MNADAEENIAALLKQLENTVVLLDSVLEQLAKFMRENFAIEDLL
jgi:hypothetical protein